MTKKSVFIISGGRDYASMFLKEGWELSNNMAEADLVLFTGGEDVTPELYGERKHPKTWNNPNRDKYEEKLYKEALELGIPMAGICRGGQFLNVMNGGKMWQHVDNHAISGTHTAKVTGFIGDIQVTSTHHQMMIPNDQAEHIVLVTANLSDRKEKMGDQGVGIISRHTNKKEDDVESVYYPNTHVLCYQPHPEFVRGEGDCRTVFFFFINNYLLSYATRDDITEQITNGIINKKNVRDYIPF